MTQQIRMPNGTLAEAGAVKAVTHAAAAVGTASTDVLAADAARCYALLINDSDTDLYLALDGGDAAPASGVVLKADGGFYEMSGAFGNLTTAKIAAIHGGTGSKRLLVTSGTGV
ncbi:MAG: hypothetical protein ACYDCO_18595 [Armatimonadota bacterium]